jgi:hypothetical protein
MQHAKYGKMDQEQIIELLLCKLWASAEEGDSCLPHTGLQLVKNRLSFPSFMTEGRQLPCWGFPGVQDLAQESIEKFSPRKRSESAFNDMQKGSIEAVASIPMGVINAFKIRSVGQMFIHQQMWLLIKPPQEISSAAPRRISEIKLKENAIRQTQHPKDHVLNSSLEKLQFPHPEASHLSTKQHIGSVFNNHREISQFCGTAAITRDI